MLAFAVVRSDLGLARSSDASSLERWQSKQKRWAVRMNKDWSRILATEPTR
jgi:hypothetical protein